jgi:hypothetical protein
MHRRVPRATRTPQRLAVTGDPHLLGSSAKLAHDLLAANLEELNVPGIYATRILVADRLKVAQLLEARPFDPLPEPTFGNITDGERIKSNPPSAADSDEEKQS